MANLNPHAIQRWAATCLVAAACVRGSAGEPPLAAEPKPAVVHILTQPPAASAAELSLPPPRVIDVAPPAVCAAAVQPGVRAGEGPTRPTPQTLKEFGQFVERTVDPENVLEVIVGRPRLLILKEPPKRVQIGGEEKNAIATSLVVSPKELSISGKEPGSTVLNLWFPDPKDPTKERILSYLVRVVPDLEGSEHAREHARLSQQRFYKALENDINRAFPDSVINLSLVGNDLIVAGQAKDIAEATQIVRVVTSNAPRARQAGGQAPTRLATVTRSATDVGLVGTRTLTTQETVAPAPEGTEPTLAPVAGTETPSDVFGVNVINMLKVPGEQQVMLKVTVAEVNRAAARSIGVNFSIRNEQGVTVFAQNTGNIAGTTNISSGSGGSSGLQSSAGSAANLSVLLDGGDVALAINALRTLNLARSLAEPNLVTMNGQPASFQAGGEFPVPVVTGFTASGLQGVSFVPFGVQLHFTPYITDKDRIRLRVTAAISTKDLASAASVNGTNVPGLNTRNFDTTVELREGQALAVAGLIQTNYAAGATRVPFFGDLPVVGRFFAFDNNQEGEQELVILVTPVLVHPLEAKELPPLPGADVFEPGDLEFYLLGRLESRRREDYRSAARTDIRRMAKYRHCEQEFIIGPQGHADGHE